MTEVWIAVQMRDGWVDCRKIDASYLVRDVAIIKRVCRQMGEPVIAVIKPKHPLDSV